MGSIIALAVGLAVVAAGIVLYLVHRRERAVQVSAEAPRRPRGDRADPRERQIETNVQQVRSLLLSIADEIHHADTAAGDSSDTLQNVRSRVDAIAGDESLREAHTVFVDQIDRVLNANQDLRSQLEQARATLVEQRLQLENLRTAVRIDSLTQVGNRAAFAERLDEALGRLRRHKEVFTLLMVDVDHFKAINDTHGHPAGDRILKGLAIKMKATLRGTDFLARYGGEEFACILLRTDAENGRNVADKLREDVKRSNFVLDSGKKLHLTISIGVAEALPDDTPATLIERADAALYRAKGEGRDRVCVATDCIGPH